jgi:hypothetical protein
MVLWHFHKRFEQVLHLSYHDCLFINTVESFQPHNNRYFYFINYSRTVNIYIVLQKCTFCQTLINSILLKLLRPVSGRTFVHAVYLRFFGHIYHALNTQFLAQLYICHLFSTQVCTSDFFGYIYHALSTQFSVPV